MEQENKTKKIMIAFFVIAFLIVIGGLAWSIFSQNQAKNEAQPVITPTADEPKKENPEKTDESTKTEILVDDTSEPVTTIELEPLGS